MRMNGKRTVSLLTAASILASLCTASFAADKTYKALDAWPKTEAERPKRARVM